MADLNGNFDQKHPNLHLSPEERRLFGQLFSAADTDNIGVVTGEVAVKFFEKTRLPPTILGEIWQIADTENRGLLTPAGFGVVLRLIGYAQAGRDVSMELALKPGGPLPKFDGINGPANAPLSVPPAPLQPQISGGAIRVPPLAPDKVNQYTSLFDNSGAQNGLLSGETAKQIFERAQLPNEILGRIWNLSDTEQRGALGLTEFIIAMHLLRSLKSGAMRALPQVLPPGLYEAAARRGAPPRQGSGSRQSSDLPSASAIPRQLTGAVALRTASPVTRLPYGTPPLSAQPTGTDWAIGPQDKTQFDNIFATVDKDNRGYITGEQAVSFFGNSRLPEDVLAQIWDLSDINSEGRLSRDEFAVAMFLIRQQRSKRDPHATLPQALPPNLVPPSMRRQPIAPQQPTAPAFDNAANINAPRPAAEDLFGLDAFSAPTPSPQVSQSTGGSTAFTPSSPRAQGSPQQLQQQSSVFKPFIPSSSFGQSMITPQATGYSSVPLQTGATRQQPRTSSADDLLGDNDPEISNRLTQETTELANLSNQVGNLTNQMQEVKSKRTSTERDVSQVSTQKKDFEARLSQLRSMYEQEVRDVSALKDRLAASRNETKKLQQDIAMIEGTNQDLQNQHRQLAGALEADQKENAALKERIRQVNGEINELRPQLEKVRSDARQQKGLVAINKKQLATNEQEREKTRGDLEGASKELGEANRELDDTHRQLEESKRAARSAPQVPGPATVASPAAVATPAASVTSGSMNPFFRRVPSESTERGMSPSPFQPQTVASPNHSAFDSFFGPSFTTSTEPSDPTSSSFRQESPSEPLDGPSASAPSHDAPGIDMPSTSHPQLTRNDSLLSKEPPAPPPSRQITSSFLPFPSGLQRSESKSSSVKASAPASRFGEDDDVDTPTDRQSSASEPPIHGNSLAQHLERIDTNRTEIGSPNLASPLGQRTPSTSSGGNDHPNPIMGTSQASESSPHTGHPGGSWGIPGAFPGDGTPPSQTHMTKTETAENATKSINAPIDMKINGQNSVDAFALAHEQARTPTSAKDDFDFAFAGFGDTGKAPAHGIGNATGSPFGSAEQAVPTHGEFPPIEELNTNEESDSDSPSDRGFDDNFTAATPHRRQESPDKRNLQATSPSQTLLTSRPEYSSTESNASQLPTAGAQASPPTYDQTITGSNGPTNGHRDANQFPQEYSGLLPSREDPMSPPPTSQVHESAVSSPTNGERVTSPFGGFDARERALAGNSLPPSQMPMAPGATAAPFAYQPSPPSTTQSPFAHNQVSAVTEQSPFSFGPSSAPAQQPQAAVPAKSAFDDEFENEFGDLAEAKEADDKGDDVFGASEKDSFDEFNPVFDSPVTSKTNNAFFDSPAPSRINDVQFSNSPEQANNGFNDLESSISGAASSSRDAPPQTSAAPAHDWDAMFAGLDEPKEPNTQPHIPPKEPFGAWAPQIPPRGISATTPPAKPPLGRALSMGTEHDDPILKRLTNMGYPRDASLAALEKFDYNIDKAADYLTSK
ncbi:Ubiquitin-associated/translation elongation factor EF1B, N-terminal, eukaryote [Lasallia pustulata]|uniref:Ubiquitin-associated/translation elongation factor EF1B, N-terminal, eukaryote n=1 Tax=Lasallia pustulata TaxID=136370 RepID=A0A1W5CYM9_9LECA|nr:Ubiquitin-associated/translation elongation factor EF1B, N-terminal, eukaryote [Lasallia pustulata]